MNDRIECGGLTRRSDLCLIELRGFPQLAGHRTHVLEQFGMFRIPICYLVVSWDADDSENLSICLSLADLARAEPLLAAASTQLNPRRVVTTQPVSILTVYGPHFMERTGLANEFIAALADNRLDVLSICSSISSVSFVVRGEQEHDVVRALSQRFEWPE